MDLSLRKATPWLVLKGSGPAADLICELLDELSAMPKSPTSPPADGEGVDGPNMEQRERVRDRISKAFPGEADLEKLVDRVRLTHPSVCQRMLAART